MNLLERAWLLKAALTGALDLKPGSQGLKLLGGIMPGAVGAPPTRGTQAMLQGYTSMPWVRAVASRVAHAVASTSWRLYALKSKPNGAEGGKFIRRKDIQQCARFETRGALLEQATDLNDLVEIHDHPLLDLLYNGNAIHGGLVVRELGAIQRDLVGECFMVKERGKLKQITALWPIAPHWIVSTPTPTHQFYRVSFRGWQGYIPATEILWFKDPDPVHPYWRGSGVAQALADELETDEYSAKYLKSFFYNSARPDMIISPKEGTVRPEEAARLERSWLQEHSGFWRAFKPMFSGRPIEVTPLEANFRQLQMKDLRIHVRDICLQVWGMPPEILGIVENSNRATAMAAAYNFVKWVVQPRLEKWRLDFQRLLVPEFDDRLIIDYVTPLDEEKDFNLDVMKAAPWAFEADEWRELAGRPKLDNERGGFHMEPIQLQRVEDWEKPPEPKPMPTGAFGQPKPPANGAPPANAAQPAEGATGKISNWSDDELLDFLMTGLREER